MVMSTATKELLKEQISTVFRERGYDGATVANLSRATGLSRSALYHHFPAGKPEMAAVIVRSCISELHNSAYRHLEGNKSAITKLHKFIDGFATYTQGGSRPCLLTILSHHAAANDELQGPQEIISQQQSDWHRLVVEVFISQGNKPKKSDRQASLVASTLHGALLLAHMRKDLQIFEIVSKRLKKTLATELT